jgi:hypothetical protein
MPSFWIHLEHRPANSVPRVRLGAYIRTIATKNPASCKLAGGFQTMKRPWQMLATLDRVAAQVTKRTKSITVDQALEIARERFENLRATGILGSKHTGPPIDPEHVTVALAFLGRCRKTRKPTVHSHDLRAAIGNGVSLGAVIAAAHALGFAVHSWLGTRTYVPGVMTNADARDVERQVTNYHP